MQRSQYKGERLSSWVTIVMGTIMILISFSFNWPSSISVPKRNTVLSQPVVLFHGKLLFMILVEPAGKKKHHVGDDDNNKILLRSATEVVAIGSIGKTPTNCPVRGGADESGKNSYILTSDLLELLNAIVAMIHEQ